MPVWTFTSGPNKVRRALGALLLLLLLKLLT